MFQPGMVVDNTPWLVLSHIFMHIHWYTVVTTLYYHRRQASRFWLTYSVSTLLQNQRRNWKPPYKGIYCKIYMLLLQDCLLCSVFFTLEHNTRGPPPPGGEMERRWQCSRKRGSWARPGGCVYTRQLRGAGGPPARTQEHHRSNSNICHTDISTLLAILTEFSQM